MSDSAPQSIVPTEGLFVLHLFYRVDRAVWQAMSATQREEGLARLEAVVARARSIERLQIVTLSMIARADIGFMLVAPELRQLNAIEKEIAAAPGASVLQPVFTYYSMTEKSEYTVTEEEYLTELREKDQLEPGSAAFEEKLAAWRDRIRYYTQTRLYPTLPDWPCVCFYPMSKRRAPEQNWYALDFARRRELMLGHARVGRKYSGRVTQLVSGSSGLDDWEWGVTLFAHNPSDIKSIVYEMRFDEVSHAYGEFGPFYNGIAAPLSAIYQTLSL